MPNSESIVNFLLVDFGGGCYLVVVVTGGKQSQLLVLGLRLEFDKKSLTTFLARIKELLTFFKST